MRSARATPYDAAPAHCRVTAAPAVHRQLLDRCQALNGMRAIPDQRTARREYENRVSTLAPTGP
ncbi:hypothetical protein ACIO3O_40150 [Streptomyces sp. NPDC087440]|uniref:hypothetical protein n=1 Tax=Streptomyces sp. NPDC087440 TaxID=3365790 RepID=UPI00381C544E